MVLHVPSLFTSYGTPSLFFLHPWPCDTPFIYGGLLRIMNQDQEDQDP